MSLIGDDACDPLGRNRTFDFSVRRRAWRQRQASMRPDRRFQLTTRVKDLKTEVTP